MKYAYKTLMMAALPVALLACSNVTVEKANPNPNPVDMTKGEGLFSGKDGNLLNAFKSDGGGLFGGKETGLGMAVNPYLWQATLDTLSFMPLAQADSAGGIVLTEWYTNPSNQEERVKVQVRILDIAFKATSLKVAVFKQVRKNGEWADETPSESTAIQLEDTILNKARVIKVKERAKN